MDGARLTGCEQQGFGKNLQHDLSPLELLMTDI
jgi:hypothetical protein